MENETMRFLFPLKHMELQAFHIGCLNTILPMVNLTKLDKSAYTTDEIIMTDLYGRLIGKSIYGGFIEV